MSNRAEIWRNLPPGEWRVVREGPVGEDAETSRLEYSRHKDSLMGWAYRNNVRARISRRENGRILRAIIEPSLTAGERAAKLVDGIPGSEPEGAHRQMEKILLRFAPPEVKAAYVRLAGPDGDGTGRADWWAYS